MIWVVIVGVVWLVGIGFTRDAITTAADEMGADENVGVLVSLIWPIILLISAGYWIKNALRGE